MHLFVIGLALALVSAVLFGLQKAYQSLPALELKRQARSGNRQASLLYRAASYGPNLQLLLKSLMAIAAAASLVLVVRSVQPIAAWVVVLVIVGGVFVWLPSVQRNWALSLATWLSSALAWLLNLIYPVMSFITRPFTGHAMLSSSDIYETGDLLDILERQKQLPYNRIPEHDLIAAQRVLSLAERSVGQAMMPMAEAKFVSAEEHLGPLLLDELHESGASSFLVYAGKKDHIVGTLNLHSALAAPGQKVQSVMHERAGYLNEQQPLTAVLEAFKATRQHVFGVVNRANDLVGVMTIEGLLAETLGEVELADGLQYEDRDTAARYELIPEPVEEVVDDIPDQLPPEPDTGSVESTPSEPLPPQAPDEVE